MWALPFLFTFIGGVFADALDLPGGPAQSRSRKLFLALSVGIVALQAALCMEWMAGRLG
jgi:hypothetical protein